MSRWVRGLTAAVVLCAAPALANDTAISLEGGAPTVIEAPGVRLVRERLTFAWQPASTEAPGDDGLCRHGYEPWDGVCHVASHWLADHEYVFESVSATGELLIGLPFEMPGAEAEAAGPQGDDPIEDLRTFVDGSAADVDVVTDPLRTNEWVAHRTYVVAVGFEPGQQRVLRHTYRGYASATAGGESWFAYLLLSGRPWDGVIERVEIEFELPAFTPCVLVSLPHTIEGNIVRVRLDDWEPDADFEIAWIEADAAARGDAFGPIDDDPNLTCDELLRGAEPTERARALELLYGAPQVEDDAPLLGLPLRECGPMHAVSATLHHDGGRDATWPPLWMQGAVWGLRYLEDPAYPASMPATVRRCIDEWRSTPADEDDRTLE